MNTRTKSFLDVTSYCSATEILASLTPEDLLVYSPTSLSKLGNISILAQQVNASALDRRKTAIDEVIRTKSFKRVISFGGGTATDTAKCIAFITNTKFICIPSMLSTNSFATNKVALYDGELKVTLDARLADEIIFDPKILHLSSPVLHRYGLADVASIHTALHDWQLAKDAIGENIDETVFDQAHNLVKSLASQIEYIDTTANTGLKTAYEMVGESGHITNLYGTGRPESGSEHILAKALEHGRTIPHGVSISLSVVMASILQNNQPEMAVSLIQGIGALEDFDNNTLTRSQIIDALTAVKPRSDRYSIINEVTLDQEQSANLVDQMFNQLELE